MPLTEIQEKACCFTGYRPNKFSFDFIPQSSEYTAFAARLDETINSLCKDGYSSFYCGMALGFDIVAGETVARLKKQNPKESIRLIAVVPFKEQAKSWSDNWQRRYNTLLSAADRIVYISESYNRGCYHLRNRYMVDNSDTVITYFSGKMGGTASTLSYAQKKGKRIINIANNSEQLNIDI